MSKKITFKEAQEKLNEVKMNSSFEPDRLQQFKKSRRLKNTIQIIPKSITTSIQTILEYNKEHATSKKNILDLSDLVGRIISEDIFYSSLDNLVADDSEISEKEKTFLESLTPVGADKLNWLSEILFQYKIAVSSGQIYASPEIANIWIDDNYRHFCDCTPVIAKNNSTFLGNDYFSLLSNIGVVRKLRFKCSECGKTIVLFDPDEEHDPISLKKYEDKLLSLVRRLDLLITVTEKKVAFTDEDAVITWEPYNQKLFSSFRTKLYRNDSSRQMTHMHSLILVADHLNLPFEVFTDESLIFDASDSEIKIPKNNFRSFACEMSLNYLLDKFQYCDDLEFDYEDSETNNNREEKRHIDNIYTSNNPRPIKTLDTKIPIELLNEAESFIQKINYYSNASKMNRNEAKKYLNKAGISTGNLESPSKKVILKHLREDILKDWIVFTNKSVGGYYPAFDVNFFNNFKIYKDYDDLGFLGKSRKVILTLHLVKTSRENIFASFDSCWRLSNTSIVRDFDISYIEVISFIRQSLGLDTNRLGPSRLKDLQDHHFYNQKSWFSLIFPDLASELKSVITKKIELIRENIHYRYSD